MANLENNFKQQYKVLGIIDDVNECGCCGRINSKATVAMKSYTSGQVRCIILTPIVRW
ncbi:hypothetical protein Q0590_14150 [Rhodocytophaga aerolata]|uniref:Uncharacterized protein n=1 Tax=Rhodocytophaga aerolata TaxID=455078 RepID=A0ABT8R5N0_9BACT|nr:hypothetical protein [Rhodocytophaga aerolata]MDO1447406.1 hypothetical protein [Rhodocytophaga aerolata]